MPEIWTSLTFHHHSISWPIDRVFRLPLVISWRPERTALLTALPRAAMLVLIVGIAQAEALVLHLAPPAPRNEKNAVSQQIHCSQHGVLTSGAWASPQKRQCSPAIGLASMRLYVMVFPCSWAWDSEVANSLTRCTAAPITLSYPIMSIPTYPPHALPPWGLVRERRR